MMPYLSRSPAVGCLPSSMIRCTGIFLAIILSRFATVFIITRQGTLCELRQNRKGSCMKKVLVICLLAGLMAGCRTQLSPQTQMLQDAALTGDLAEVRRNLSDGADINAKDNIGCSPIMRAVSAGHIEVVKLLLSRGANVNTYSESGITPLITAVVAGNMEMVSVLIEKGANINARAGDGSSPLRIAVSRKQDEVAGLLISLGAQL